MFFFSSSARYVFVEIVLVDMYVLADPAKRSFNPLVCGLFLRMGGCAALCVWSAVGSMLKRGW